MASSKGYLDYILERLSPLEGVSYRAMMGEYIIYCRGKIIGGIYDDRLLVKPTKALKRRFVFSCGTPRRMPLRGRRLFLRSLRQGAVAGRDIAAGGFSIAGDRRAVHGRVRRADLRAALPGQARRIYRHRFRAAAAGICYGVGVAFADRENPDADTALYRVKEAGRCGRVIF